MATNGPCWEIAWPWWNFGFGSGGHKSGTGLLMNREETDENTGKEMEQVAVRGNKGRSTSDKDSEWTLVQSDEHATDLEMSPE